MAPPKGMFAGANNPNYSHGHKTGGTETQEYKSWLSMIDRCERKRCLRFKDYGARGITICRRWRESFNSFLIDMGKKPTREHSLDRINNDGNYEPSNCRWATKWEQANNSRKARKIKYQGMTKSVAEWSRILGISYSRLITRLHRGWPTLRAFGEPKFSGWRRQHGSSNHTNR